MWRSRNSRQTALVGFANLVQDYGLCTSVQSDCVKIQLSKELSFYTVRVIGRKKFIYDLWGDAVNTASRMESHGTGGTIQITRSTYDLVKDEFVCQSRGTVNVKGKGELDVWHVLRSVD